MKRPVNEGKERQQKHVQDDAKEFTQTIRTRLDAFGRVFGGVRDGVDGGGLVVEKGLNGEEEMWSANGSEKKRKQVEIPHDELIGQGIEHKVGVQTKRIGSALASLSYRDTNIGTWTNGFIFMLH